MGKSSCSSEAPRSAMRSKVRSTTSSGRASWRSILFMTTMGLRPSSMALRSTKRVWGMGPSAASTRSRQPSTMPRTRSTSPPKSVWPGVSTMLILTPPPSTAGFLARMRGAVARAGASPAPPAEVRVARGVYYVDLDAPVLDGGVFSQDGDATFLLQHVRVHGALCYLLPVAEL